MDWCPPYTGGVEELELPGWAPSGYESPQWTRKMYQGGAPANLEFHPLFSSALSQDDFQQLPASPETFLNVSASVPSPSSHADLSSSTLEYAGLPRYTHTYIPTYTWLGTRPPR